MSISTRVIAHQKEKWGVFRRFVFPVVVHEFSQGEVTSPIRLLVISEESEVCFYPLVVALRLPIGAGVICRGDVLLNPQSPTQLFDELGGKSRISITYDLAGEAVVSDYDLQKYLCGFFGRDGFVTGYKVRHLCTALVRDGEYGVVPLGQG